jgi:hypothetical protein
MGWTPLSERLNSTAFSYVDCILSILKSGMRTKPPDMGKKRENDSRNRGEVEGG